MVGAVLYRQPRDAALLAFAAASLTLAVGIAVDRQLSSIAVAGATVLVGIVLRAPRVAWRGLLASVLVVVLFVPIRRFTFPGSLPIQLEPYRLLVGLVLLAWISSLLADPSVRVRRSGLEGPIAVIAIGVFASVVVNPSGVAGVPAEVTKALMFFLSFVLFFYFMVSVVRDWDDVDRIVRLLVGGGAIVAFFALVEYRMRWSLFDQFAHIPFLQKINLPIEDPRGGRPRPYGSAEHPIALSALLVILLPLTVYLVRRHGRIWWLAAGVLLPAMAATVSRTGVVMLGVTLLALLWMRPREVWRWLPLLIPLLLMTKVVAPGAIGSLRYQFNPAGGIIANQSTSRGNVQAGNRLTDVGPVFSDVARKPLFGIGYGVRVRGSTVKTGRVLDDQWLGTLYDTGFVGLLGWFWLVVRYCRRVARSARGDDTPEGWLKVALVASVLSFAVGMLTFDAFSFIQVTFVFYTLLALGAIIAIAPDLSGARSPRRLAAAAPADAGASG